MLVIMIFHAQEVMIPDSPEVYSKKYKMKILIGITGSIASILYKKLESALLVNTSNEIKIIATQSAIKILQRKFSELEFNQNDYLTDMLLSENNSPKYLTDESEWAAYETGKVLHVDLAKWADRFVIAPCTMNTLAKIRYGLSDNLLTNTVSAWNFRDPKKRFILAIAGNTVMYESAIAQDNINNFVSINKADHKNISVISPIVKELYCGDFGSGAMAHVDQIAKAVLED